MRGKETISRGQATMASAYCLVYCIDTGNSPLAATGSCRQAKPGGGWWQRDPFSRGTGGYCDESHGGAYALVSRCSGGTPDQCVLLAADMLVGMAKAALDGCLSCCVLTTGGAGGGSRQRCTWTMFGCGGVLAGLMSGRAGSVPESLQ